MKISFIGCGNMARAMINGLIKDGFENEKIMATAVSDKTIEYIDNVLEINSGKDNAAAAEWADVIILAVKPVFLEQVIKDIKKNIGEKKIVVSLAAGKSLDWYKEQFGNGVKNLKMIRCMPNTPAMVGEGMTAICHNENVTEAELGIVQNILTSFGKAEVVPERLMDAVTGVSGSSPAFVFMFIEAMADAAVAEGMPRKQAYDFAAQSVLGSAKLVLESGKHPAELKDMVCSPGGTTIEGVCALESSGFRASVEDAVRIAAEKSRQM